ncbi:lipopolysaccharide biosynthesis protein [Pleurocapsales cyanobacterium LEGE 06147]|nr:lipopolysaccharide biosynthesis protein [Pleurocapsales cyanobacterium LEGE 06147]
MINCQSKIDKFKKIFFSRYLRNVGWLGIAELFNRIFRLGTTITLARVFSTEDYGLMAIIYTTFEIALVFTFKHGISAKIIQAEKKHLSTICNTSYWLNWFLCISLFIFQCLAAFIIAYFYNNNELIFPLCISALVYLFFPLFMINSAIIERENRFKVTAICNASQTSFSNLLIVVFALLGWGIWSIVWPMVLSPIIWIFITWKYCSWRPPQKFTLEGWREIANFGKNLLGVEILNKLRMNIDYLLVGKFLGVEALGIYFFAFNAGSGITTNVVYAFTSALFPHLCEAREDRIKLKKQYYNSLKSIALILIPLVLLQSSLAPFYVPIIFGKKWISAVPILMMICLSVIPRTFSWTASILLNSVNKTHLTLYLDMIFTIIFVVSILTVVQRGIYWVAAAVLLSHAIILPIFSIWAFRQVFVQKC